MDLVRQALTEALTPYADGELVGVSCLARGADQLFAEAVLAVGGQLEVVLPSADYRETKVKPDNLEQFDRLLVRSSLVRYMSHLTAGRQAYEDANEAVIGSVDRLFAVWTASPLPERRHRGRGGGCPGQGRAGGCHLAGRSAPRVIIFSVVRERSHGLETLRREKSRP